MRDPVPCNTDLPANLTIHVARFGFVAITPSLAGASVR